MCYFLREYLGREEERAEKDEKEGGGLGPWKIDPQQKGFQESPPSSKEAPSWAPSSTVPVNLNATKDTEGGREGIMERKEVAMFDGSKMERDDKEERVEKKKRAEMAGKSGRRKVRKRKNGEKREEERKVWRRMWKREDSEQVTSSTDLPSADFISVDPVSSDLFSIGDEEIKRPDIQKAGKLLKREGSMNEERMSEERMNEERMSEERMSEGRRMSEERMSEERMSKKRMSEERMSEGRRMSEERMSEERMREERMSEGRMSEWRRTWEVHGIGGNVLKELSNRVGRCGVKKESSSVHALRQAGGAVPVEEGCGLRSGGVVGCEGRKTGGRAEAWVTVDKRLLLSVVDSIVDQLYETRLAKCRVVDRKVRFKMSGPLQQKLTKNNLFRELSLAPNKRRNLYFEKGNSQLQTSQFQDMNNENVLV